MTAEQLAVLRARFHAMADRALDHCLEVYGEKGPWDGEDPLARLMQLEARLSILHSLLLGLAAPLDDAGRPRTLAGEYAKAACSLAIFGDLTGSL